MKCSQHQLIIVLIGLWLVSCSPAYVPNKVNTGLFTEEGEMHGEIATGVSGLDVQVAAAVPGNLVVTANASLKDRDFTTSSFEENDDDVIVINDNKKHRIWEAGLGYYHIAEDGLRLEAIVGFGHGNLENVETSLFGPINNGVQIDDDTFITSSTFNKVFIQPTIGYSSEKFDAGFTPKIAFVRVNLNDQQFRDTFFEPTATLRFGHKNVKFTGQLGLSLPMDEEVEFSHEPFIFSVGVMADINVLKLGKKGGD
ncbi:MAG: hypothetical protein R8G66_15790 [Cytophagales bacterium]|nr:hypothetical protein [Cytophagales bacterium]